MKEFSIQNLHGKTAENILIETHQVNVVPIDIQKILRHYGLLYTTVDFSNVEQIAAEQVEKYGPILGGTVSTDEDGTVICCTNISDVLIKIPPRVIMAHEFAHLCLFGQMNHIRFLGGSSSTAEQEYKALKFATELLLPTSQIRSVSGGLMEPSVKTLAKTFQVPLSVMAFRLERCLRAYFI